MLTQPFRKGARLFAMLLIFTSLLACGTPPATSVPPTLPPTLPPPTTTSAPATATTPSTPAPESVQGISKLCLIVGLSGISGFNGYSYQGMQSIAEEYGIESVYFSVPETEPSLQPCLDSGAQVIITAGFPYAEATLAAAQANPDIYFIGVDLFLSDGPENCVGIQAREDEAGFLMGYLAGLVTESNVVAGVYGPPFPALKRFRNGYEQGVALAAQETNKEIEVLGVYLENFRDMAGGEAAARDFLAQGADVLFGPGGSGPEGGGTRAMRYAVQQQTYVIGVDEDEYFSTFEGGQAEGSEYIISSALKRVDVGVYDMLQALMEGRLSEFPGGGNYTLSTANGGIGFASRHEADIPEEIYAQVADVSMRLAKGDVTTGVDPVTGDLLESP